MDKSEKWMRFCIDGARLFSTCAKRKYFAFILDKNGRVVGTGYNGVPKKMIHCEDGGCPRLNEDSLSGSVYSNCYACHAEINALTHSDFHGRQGGSLFINGTPCFDCAKVIANSGLSYVYYMDDPNYKDWPRVENLLTEVGIKLVSVEIK